MSIELSASLWALRVEVSAVGGISPIERVGDSLLMARAREAMSSSSDSISTVPSVDFVGSLFARARLESVCTAGASGLGSLELTYMYVGVPWRATREIPGEVDAVCLEVVRRLAKFE